MGSNQGSRINEKEDIKVEDFVNELINFLKVGTKSTEQDVKRILQEFAERN